jgi:hypothetical protein
MIKHATEVFEDPELVALCDDGLNKQLQRTKDGATEASRIQELAGILLKQFLADIHASHAISPCNELLFPAVGNTEQYCVSHNYLYVPDLLCMQHW